MRTKVLTFGCRLNTFETEVMRQHAADSGLTDTVIVNTCAVTAEAVRQAAQTIRRTRREQPDARIVVTGCAAQIDPDRFATMAEVDHVIGNAEKLDKDTFARLAKGQGEAVSVNDIMSVTETAGHLIAGFSERARAYVQVQNGCDHRCTFCIIPFGRGPSRSVPAGEVVAQIRQLVEAGYKEVVLTGVDMTAYGRDLPGAMTLGKLTNAILRHVPDLPRLRLSSIDSIEADAALLDALAEQPRLMPHLHLSLQAGHDLTLKRMKRRHLRAHTVEFCAQVRRLRPDVVFGADLIAGFPTENEDMFQGTVDLVEDCALTYLHVFPYSSRPGTPAARMPQLARPVVKARAAKLRDIGRAALERHLSGQMDRIVEVLMEDGTRGRTPCFAEMSLRSSASPGEIVRARVTGHDGSQLSGAQI